MTRIVVLDYGSGNVRSVVHMLRRIGAEVELTADPEAVARADGLYVPGVGAYYACLDGLIAVRGDELIRERLQRGRAVLGVCVGHQVLFDGSTEFAQGHQRRGVGCWEGTVEPLKAPVVPHMGWSQVTPPPDSRLFEGVADERFYFVHSFAAKSVVSSRVGGTPAVTWAEHGEDFVAAVENGPLSGTQFHPEKSGDAGARLLRNWINTF
jgi:glutamine amidotransferase